MNILKNIINQLKSLLKSTTVINIITVAGVSLLIKSLAFYKEIVIANEFGLSDLLDSFFIAMIMPTFISQVFIIAFNNVFIPNYIAEQKSNPKNISAFQATSFAVTIVAALFFIGVTYLISDYYLETIFPDKSQAFYSLVKNQLTIILPCVLFWGLTSVLMGLLNIKGEFRYATIYPVFTTLSLLVCIFFFKTTLQEHVLAVGILTGAILQFIFLLIVAYCYKILHISFPDFKSKNAITMFKQVPAKVSSGFLVGLIPVTDQYFATQLAVGSVAALNYGLKIPAFIATIIIMATGNVLLPYFSNLNIDNPESAFKKLYLIIQRIFLVLLPVIVILFFFSEDIIAFFFERDNFTSEDTVLVSKIQQIFLIGIPFEICGLIIVRFLTSINKNAFMAYVSLITMILNIILDFALVNYIGLMGIALCTALLHAFRYVLFFRYVKLQHQKIKV